MLDRYPSVVREPRHVPETDLDRRAAIFDPEHQIAIEQAQPLDRAAVSDDDQLPALRSDYDAMRSARIVGDGAPEFEALIERIRLLETEANRASAPTPPS